MSTDLTWTDVSGRATLRGWTQIFIPAVPGREAPITVAECALAEDPRSILVVLDESGATNGAAIGAPVAIGFRRDDNGWSYPEIVKASAASR